MAIQALQAATTAAARARDSGMMATPKANIYDLMSRLQAAVSNATKSVIATSSLTLLPFNQTYNLSTALPLAIKVVDIRNAQGDSIDGPVPLESLKWLNLDWWREVGPIPRSWCQVGQDLLIIRPCVEVQQTLTVVYSSRCTALAVDGDTFSIPDEDIQLVMDPTEFLLDLKARDMNNCKLIFERWVKQVDATRKLVR